MELKIHAGSEDPSFLEGKYSESFISELARQITLAIEDAMGVSGLDGSTLRLELVFAPGTYMEHTSDNVTYRRLLLSDKSCQARDFWVKWTRLDGAVAYTVSDDVTAETISFELGEDVPQKIREREFRFLCSKNPDKYQAAMGKKTVTEWRDLIKRAVRRGDIVKLESELSEASHSDDVQDKLLAVLGSFGKSVEVEREEESTPSFDSIMELARAALDDSAADEARAETDELFLDLGDGDAEDTGEKPAEDSLPWFAEDDGDESSDLEEDSLPDGLYLDLGDGDAEVTGEKPAEDSLPWFTEEDEEESPDLEDDVLPLTVPDEADGTAAGAEETVRPSEEDIRRELEERIRRELEEKIRLEYEERDRERRDAAERERREGEERMRRENERLAEMARLAEAERARHEAEKLALEEQKKKEAEELRISIEARAEREARERDRLAEAARRAVIEERCRELERQREREERERREAAAAPPEPEQAAASATGEEAAGASEEAAPELIEYLAKHARLMFRRPADLNVITRIKEIIENTLIAEHKENIPMHIKAYPIDETTIGLDILRIPESEKQLLVTMMKALGNGHLGIIKITVE
ncbi:MAG: hypothetical protein IJW48_04750 [Clostridia bacterium]|nr:hypothetical protein [Clostridia bacterium]